LGDELITERDDLQGKKPLHLACLEENEEIVNVLIDEKTPLNSRDTSGRIPLQCALDRKNKRIVNRLLSSMSKLEPVESLDWFNLKDKETTWVEISQRTTGRGFDYKLIDKIQRNMFLSEGQRRL
jgi:ankyrin repeat protein